MNHLSRFLSGFVTVITSAAALAQMPPKLLPPAGVEIPQAQRAELTSGLEKLQTDIDAVAADTNAKSKSLLPDVQIYARAVAVALKHNEFFKPEDAAKAAELLAEGTKRAEQLAAGESPWTKQIGLVVRGYISKIDGSVQPYGLIVPESYRPGGNDKFRLDIWLHGRNENLSEVNFLDERRKKPGEFTPADTIVLHPYGRYCNANRFAGEVDVLEALAAVQKQYRIDDDRVAMRGFSMGGAGCWQMAVHHADRWVAATPGAGFVDAINFLKMNESDVAAMPPWQRRLLNWYDVPPWAGNLYHCPTIAYSGELDPQKLAADTMTAVLKDEGIVLRHVIGPMTAHKYHPDAKITLDNAVASIAEAGRDRQPLVVQLVTYTLRCNKMAWVEVVGLMQHWREARVVAELAADDEVYCETQNVSEITFRFPPGWCPLDVTQEVLITIDEQDLHAPRPLSDRSWTCTLHRNAAGQWKVGPRPSDKLRKKPGLQGPIDDAFMDSFIFVRPTGKSKNAAMSAWVDAELNRAIARWRSTFRGDARVKDDTAVTEADIAGANLILWGDAESNAVIRKINDKLPVRWEGENIVAGRQTFPAASHAPILIYPNPLNDNRYVVLNSGFTFREDANTSNARQYSRLPDWAVIDVRTPPDAVLPGKIAAADFFDEQCEINSGTIRKN